MTRLRFLLAGLFGGAAAGQKLTDEPQIATGYQCAKTLEQQQRWPNAPLCDPATVPAWRFGPALNGQCPVCGTMAPPYVRPIHDVSCVARPIGLDSGNMMVLECKKELWGALTQEVVCALCNVVFQQRVEEPKP